MIIVAIVCFEGLNVLAVHHSRNLIRLPPLEREARSSVRVILAVGLVFVVFDLGKIRVRGIWVEGEGDEGVDRRRLDSSRERPGL